MRYHGEIVKLCMHHNLNACLQNVFFICKPCLPLYKGVLMKRLEIY